MATRGTPPGWRRAFLRELGRSGSVAAAADACGIDRSSAYQLRKRNAAFAQSWDRAQEGARKRLGQAMAGIEPCSPQCVSSGCEALPEAELERPGRGVSTTLDTNGGEQGPIPSPFVSSEVETLRTRLSTSLEANGKGELGAPAKLRDNEIVRASKSGRPCIVRAGPGRWSAESERVFLETLTATANVSAAARAAGVSTVAAYNRRKQWPAFAQAWREAKAEGYERVEMMLLHSATASLDPEPAPQALGDTPPMSIDQAMNLMKLHRASQLGGKPQRYGWRQQEPDIEEVRAEILRKVAAIERARGKSAGQET